MKRRVAYLLLGAVSAAVMLLSPATVMAQQASSSSYSVDEVFFGAGGELDACSSSYCSKQSAGELAAGNTSSTSYQAQAGFNSNREEYLEFIVTSGSTNLGYLSSSSAATATGTFSVKAYLAGGYNVINASNPPTNSSAPSQTLTALTSPTAYNSSTSVEQFGINLAANTSPTTFGAAPSQSPDGTFSSGAAASGYNTANQYKYVKGDTVASSSTSSGTTNYTVSYLFKIADTTPAGHYTFNHVLVAVPSY